MRHWYAGILALIAFTTIVARGVLGAANLQETLQAACLGLFVWAGIGYVLGQIADQTVTDSVHAQFDAQLRDRDARGKT